MSSGVLLFGFAVCTAAVAVYARMRGRWSKNHGHVKRVLKNHGQVKRVLTFPFDEKRPVRQWYELVNQNLCIWTVSDADWAIIGSEPKTLYEAVTAIQSVPARWLHAVGYIYLNYLARSYVYAALIEGTPIHHTCVACGGTDYVSSTTNESQPPVQIALLCNICSVVSLQTTHPDAQTHRNP